MAVISVVPEEDVENIAYLAIFMLCFTTSDKAPILCLFLIELKSSVINHSGLMQAVLKTLGMNEGIQ